MIINTERFTLESELRVAKKKKAIKLFNFLEVLFEPFIGSLCSLGTRMKTLFRVSS